MQDLERVDLVVELLEILDTAGYGAIVRQHRATVEDGRMVEIRQDDLPKERRGRTDLPKVGDMRRRDLTAKEQLSLLIDLIEVAAGGSVAVEERTLGMASEFLNDDATVAVSFSADAREDLEPWSLPEVSNEHRSAVSAVVETLDELRSVSEVKRAAWLEEHVERRAPSDRIAGGW